jgi:hypothetical protein
MEAGDLWTFVVPATDFIESVTALVLLDPSFDVAALRPVLKMVTDRALESGAVSAESEEKLTVLENMFDATASTAILLDGHDSANARELFGAGLSVRQRETSSNFSNLDEDIISRSLLRLFHLGQYESVLSTFESHLNVNPAAFTGNPVVQMANTLYLLSATRCERGRSVENAEFGAKVWFDLTVFWWLAAKSKAEYSLESYRLLALIDAFETGADRARSIDVDQLIERMEQGAGRFIS